MQKSKSNISKQFDLLVWTRNGTSCFLKIDVDYGMENISSFRRSSPQEQGSHGRRPSSKSANQPASGVICQHFLEQQQPGPSLSQPQILLKAIDSPLIHCPELQRQ